MDRMELDLTGQLERRAEAPAASDSSPAVEEPEPEVNLELSLWWPSGEVGCRKRVRESDEEVERKKPKMEVGPVAYGVQVMPVTLQGINGFFYAFMGPCWVPCAAMDVVENTVYMPEGNRDLAVEMNGGVAGDRRMEVSSGEGSNSTGCSNSGVSVLQIISEKEARRPD